MISSVCAILAIAACWQGPTNASPSPLALYTEAAEHIRSGHPDAAIDSLSALLAAHADSPLAEKAALHLVECYLLSDQPRLALDLLQAWSPKLDRSQAIEAPGSRPSHSPVDLQTRCHILLSRQAEAEGKHLAALEQQLQIPPTQKLIPEQALCREHVRLALLVCEQATRQGSAPDCLAPLWDLLSRHDIPPQEIGTLQFAVAEWCNTHAHYDLADSLWKELEASLEKPPQPEWAATVWLRRAEHQVRLHEYQSAKATLQKLADRNADFQGQQSAQFLAARIAIAEIEFDRALTLLAEIARSPHADESARACAHWLTGEVLFLQHRFDEAIAAYQRAMAYAAPEWQTRALLQAGKCYEKTNRPKEALVQYRRVADEHSQSSACQAAMSRIAVLERHLSATPGGLER